MGSAEKITDRELKELERKVSSVYRDAAADVSRICNEYWTTGSPEQPSYQQRLQTMQERLAAGEITKEYYRQWVRNNIGRGERWNTLRDEISRRAATANQVAAAYINDTTPGIYSLNANRTAYAIEQTDVGAGLDFVLVNEQAVRNLVMGNNQYEFRTVRPDRQRDYAWNSEKIERQLTLGILAGDSVKHMTDRFMTVMGSNRKAAIRNARTAITSAQNAGSLHTMQAARDKGIDCKKEWLATTSDNLTRDSHLLMDGIRVELDDDFPIGLAYPGDPKGDPAEVYNCRCTMITIFPGINDMKTDDDGNEITYEEWLADKMERGLMPPTRESDEDTAGDVDAGNESELLSDDIVLTDEQIDNISRGLIVRDENGDYVDKNTGDVYTEDQLRYAFSVWDSKQVTRESIEYTPFKTKSDCEKYAREVLGVSKVDFGKLRLDYCNTVLQEFTYLKEKYGLVPYDGISIRDKLGGHALASTGGRNFNLLSKIPTVEKQRQWFLDTQNITKENLDALRSRLESGQIRARQMVERAERTIRVYENDLSFSRFSTYTSDTIEDTFGLLRNVVDHEYGHILDFHRAGTHRTDGTRDIDLSGYIRVKYDEFKSDGSIHQLSKYGSTNETEMVAEIFAAKENGETLPIEFEIIYRRIATSENLQGLRYVLNV